MAASLCRPIRASHLGKGPAQRPGPLAAGRSPDFGRRIGGAARGPGEASPAGRVAGTGDIPSGAAVRLGNALATPTPFRERLVWFWTNHFMVSLHRPVCAAVAGAFVEEAIRPHVTGHFADMLLAVMHHPRDAAVPRQRLLGGAEQPGGQEWQAGAERESGAGMPRTAHREPRRRINPGGRDELRARADRLVDRPARLPVPPVRARAGGCRPSWAGAFRLARKAAWQRCGFWRPIPRRIAFWPANHGTGTVEFVLGGAVSGGRVVAEWPGLGPGKLFADRDLQPTADLRSVAKGLLALHLCLGAAELAVAFPDSAAAEPMNGLIWTDG